MAIEIASNSPSFLSSPISLLPTTAAKKHSNNQCKPKLRRSAVHYDVFSLFVLFGRPPLTMNAVSATIFGDWRVISPKQDKMIEITAYYGVSLLSCSKKKNVKERKRGVARSMGCQLVLILAGAVCNIFICFWYISTVS